MRFLAWSFVLACTSVHSNWALHDGEALKVNPIRKVVTLLQGMADKVEREGEKEKDLYDKFMCNSKTSKTELEKSIKENSDKVPTSQSDIDEADSAVAKLKEDLKSHQASLTAAEKAMSEATSVREAEKQKFEAEASEKKGFIASLDKALPALKTGMTGTQLLQTQSVLAVSVRKATMADISLTDDDRDSVMAFLSDQQGAEETYSPSSGEVVGILATMKADYEKDLSSIIANEDEAIKLYQDLMAAKGKEAKTLTMSIQKKTQRVGEISVNIVNWKHDLKELEAMVAADQKMLQNVEDSMQTEELAFNERQKTHSEELRAIHETVKILNDDDALDIFKATLPSSSLLQIRRDGRSGARRLDAARSAAKTLQSRSPDRPELRFLEMALLGKKVDFSKVTKLIDDMITLMAHEQTDDDNKKKYCVAELRSAASKAEEISKSIKEQEANEDERLETVQGLADDIKALKSQVVDVDKLVADATNERKAQNQEFSELMSSNTAAKDILKFAAKRLAKFYVPEESRKKVQLTVKTSVLKKDPFPESASPLSQLPGQTGLMSKRALFKVLDSRRPATAFISTYQKRLGDSNEVTAMINQLVHELTLEMRLADKDEERSQKAYEELLADSTSKRATYMKSINVKEMAKAENEEMRTKEAGLLAGSHQKLEASKAYERDLHGDCDWMLENFDLRRSARADEAENLKKAKATLHGADFSFAQAHTFLGRHRV